MGLTSLTIKPGVDAVFRRIGTPIQLSEEFTRLPVVGVSRKNLWVWTNIFQWSSPSLKELVVMHHIPFTDAQFLKLRIPWFEIICRTLSEEAINQYLHVSTTEMYVSHPLSFQKWSSGELMQSKRFGISVDRQIDQQVVMKGLLVVQWDEDFCATMTELVESTAERIRTSRFTVFRTVTNAESVAEEDKECSNGTLYFDFDGSIYFEVTKKNREFEEKLNQTQRERAKFAPWILSVYLFIFVYYFIQLLSTNSKLHFHSLWPSSQKNHVLHLYKKSCSLFLYKHCAKCGIKSTRVSQTLQKTHYCW